MIYFIQGAKTRLIKIGKAVDPIRRLKEDLQTGSPDKLFLLKEFYTDDTEAERLLHQRFDAHRLHGEWFSPSEKLLLLINTLPLSISVPSLIILLDELGVSAPIESVARESRRIDRIGLSESGRRADGSPGSVCGKVRYNSRGLTEKQRLDSLLANNPDMSPRWRKAAEKSVKLL